MIRKMLCSLDAQGSGVVFYPTLTAAFPYAGIHERHAKGLRSTLHLHQRKTANRGEGARSMNPGS